MYPIHILNPVHQKRRTTVRLYCTLFTDPLFPIHLLHHMYPLNLMYPISPLAC